MGRACHVERTRTWPLRVGQKDKKAGREDPCRSLGVTVMKDESPELPRVQLGPPEAVMTGRLAAQLEAGKGPLMAQARASGAAARWEGSALGQALQMGTQEVLLGGEQG